MQDVCCQAKYPLNTFIVFEQRFKEHRTHATTKLEYGQAPVVETPKQAVAEPPQQVVPATEPVSLLQRIALKPDSGAVATAASTTSVATTAAAATTVTLSAQAPVFVPSASAATTTVSA